MFSRFRVQIPDICNLLPYFPRLWSPLYQKRGNDKSRSVLLYHLPSLCSSLFYRWSLGKFSLLFSVIDELFLHDFLTLSAVLKFFDIMLKAPIITPPKKRKNPKLEVNACLSTSNLCPPGCCNSNNVCRAKTLLA